MSALQKSVLKSRLPSVTPSSRAAKRMTLKKRDYTPVQWSQYFEKFLDVKVGTSNFRVYLRGTSGPVLVLLHGGGLSALGWSLFSVSITKMVKCRTVAIDLRGHGSTKTDDDLNLSAETLSKDVGDVVKAMYQNDPPPIILMGHSMGGAIAVHTAYSNYVPSLIGLVVIDVVEGTALEALSSMQSFLRGRPKTFTSLEHAIEWCVRSAQVRNVDSAKVSMPGQIVNCETGELAINDISSCPAARDDDDDDDAAAAAAAAAAAHTASNPDRISEEDGDAGDDNSSLADNFKAPGSKEAPKARYKWRIDLTKTEAHWPGWFRGLSGLFLSCPVPKLLILAGIDTLDRELTVGQMQGKFQMQVLPQCGHAVHEDKPEKVAEVLTSYMVRFKFAEPSGEFHRPFPSC